MFAPTRPWPQDRCSIPLIAALRAPVQISTKDKVSFLSRYEDVLVLVRSYARAGNLGVSHMFLLRVILGGVEQGRPEMDLPSNSDLYDSAADNVDNPSEIIVWTPYLYSRILIEYVISFQSEEVWY